MGVILQIYGTAIVCFLTLIIGFTFTWPSSSIELFQNENSTILTRVMTETEVSLLGSLSSVGALVFTPIYGYLLDKIGRKWSMVIAGLPYAIAWSIIAASHQVELILAAMFLSGVGGAAFVVTPVYISEITQDSIRGSMTSSTIIMMSVGTLLSYICGGYLSYYATIYIALSMCALYLILSYLLKDSPLFLMQKGLEEDAANSIAFYRSTRPDSKEVLEEISNIKRILNADFELIDSVEDATPAEKEKLNDGSNAFDKNAKLTPWKFLWKSKSSRRALFLSLALITSSIYMGMVIVQVYAQPIFAKVIPTMSPSVCTILFAVIIIVSTIISAYLIDKAGRKILMIGSAMGSGVCALVLGTQLQFEWGPDVITPIAIYVFCVCFSFGAANIPFVLIAELFLPEVKSFCSMLAVEWAWTSNFLILLVYYPLASVIGVGFVFCIFSAIAFATAAFCYFFLPETKGLSVDVIQSLLVHGKIRN